MFMFVCVCVCVFVCMCVSGVDGQVFNEISHIAVSVCDLIWYFLS